MSDNQSIPFRSPTPVDTTPAVDTGSAADATGKSPVSKSDDVPPSLHQELEKKPYAVKFLNLDLYHDDDAFEDVREQAKALDEYVLKQMKASGLKDTPESYKEVIDAIYKQIGKSNNEDPTKALKRLSVASKALNDLRAAKLEPVLNAKSMDPDDFLEVQP